MKNTKVILLALCLLFSGLMTASCGKEPARDKEATGTVALQPQEEPLGEDPKAYLDSALPVEARVRDLLRRMNRNEKLGQLFAIPALAEEKKAQSGLSGAAQLLMSKLTRQKSVGNFTCVLTRFPPDGGAKLVNRLQRHAMEISRLGIPMLVQEECIHGCVAQGSAIFPVSIALASTWNPELLFTVAEAIGREARSRGIHQALSPTINLARDPRCGRTEETYGEDPYLASRMAVAFVKGLQSQGVAATPKHFVANFAADGGRDSHAVHPSERLLREIYFPPFEAAVREGGALSIMAAYNSLDGMPCHANAWLLRKVLKEEWEFQGFVVSDFTGVDGLFRHHGVARDPIEAARKALMAGVDVELPGAACFRKLARPLDGAPVPAEVLDEAVRRVLRVKFSLGLFENPFADPAEAARVVDCEAHRKLAREAAEQAMVLLKNEGPLLPLRSDMKSIAVIGPNAEEGRTGGYSGSGVQVISPLEGIRNAVSKSTRILFTRGCDIAEFRKTDKSKKQKAMIVMPENPGAGIPEAIRLAKEAECVLLFVGNQHGAEGEGMDRSDLTLPGAQEELIRSVCEVNDQVIVVLINGSAVVMENWIDEAEAVLEAWYPGEEGGAALANILFGEANPGGKLPVTFPRRTGQLPLYYNPKPAGRIFNDYVDLRGDPARFPFGHGLSYTTFGYKNLEIEREIHGGRAQVAVRFDLSNTGRLAGDEVVQLYLHKPCSELTRPLMELKRFRRIRLEPGETRSITFLLGDEDFTYLDLDLKPGVEKGEFEILLGASSKDIRLQGKTTL